MSVSLEATQVQKPLREDRQLREERAARETSPRWGEGGPKGRVRERARVLEAELTARISGEVRFDRTARMLYSTDATNYQIEPVGAG